LLGGCVGDGVVWLLGGRVGDGVVWLLGGRVGAGVVWLTTHTAFGAFEQSDMFGVVPRGHPLLLPSVHRTYPHQKLNVYPGTHEQLLARPNQKLRQDNGRPGGSRKNPPHPEPPVVALGTIDMGIDASSGTAQTGDPVRSSMPSAGPANRSADTVVIGLLLR
jgi:hypothetical protein